MFNLLKAIHRLPSDLRVWGLVMFDEFTRACKNEVGSVSFDEALVQQFNSQLLLEYGNDKTGPEGWLDPMVIHRGVKGATDHFDRLGNVIAARITTRHGDTVPLNPEHSKRMSRLLWSHAPVYLDTFDEVRSLIEAVNGYRTMMVRSLKNDALKQVIDAALGAADVGLNGSGGTQALPSSQLIAIDTTPNNLLTYEKIKSAAVILSHYGVPTGAQNRVFLYSPGQLRAIMSITQATSTDFTSKRILELGSIDGQDWLGFHWVEVHDVKNEGAGGITNLQRLLPLTSTTRTCIAMGRQGVGLSIGKEPRTSINVIHDKNDSILVRPEMMMGAVRVWDGAVVSIAALEQTT